MDRKKTATLIAVVLTVVVGSAGYGLRAKQSHGPGMVAKFGALPYHFGEYSGVEERFDEGTYTVLGADTTTLRRYVDGAGDRVWLFAAYFGEQNYGQQIHSPRQCLPGGGWQIDELTQVPVDIPGPGNLSMNRMLIESNGRHQVMYYFFATRTGFVARELDLKWHLARAALSFQPRDAAFLRFTAPIEEGNVTAADHSVRTFMAEAVPYLLKGLPF